MWIFTKDQNNYDYISLNFCFLLLLFILTLTQNMFFGLTLICIGLLFFYLKFQGFVLAENSVLTIGVYTVIWGLITIVVAATNFTYEHWIKAGFAAGVFLGVGIYQGIIKAVKCREKITAVCAEIKAYTTGNGGTYFEPLFLIAIRDAGIHH